MEATTTSTTTSPEEEQNNTSTINNDDEADKIEESCLQALASDLTLNIEELWNYYINEGGNQVVETPEIIDARTRAGQVGRELFIAAVRSGKSLVQAETEAFNEIFSERRVGGSSNDKSTSEEYQLDLEADFNQALKDYCKSGKCFKFIK